MGFAWLKFLGMSKGSSLKLISVLEGLSSKIPFPSRDTFLSFSVSMISFALSVEEGNNAEGVKLKKCINEIQFSRATITSNTLFKLHCPIPLLMKYPRCFVQSNWRNNCIWSTNCSCK